MLYYNIPMRPARLRKRENPECHRLRVAGPTWSLSPFRGYAWGIALRCRSWPPSSRSLESSRIRNGSICSSSPWRLRHLLWRCFSRAAGDSGGSGSVAPLASRGLSPAFRGGGGGHLHEPRECWPAVRAHFQPAAPERQHGLRTNGIVSGRQLTGRDRRII
jgi:hypothetical protein